MNWKALLPATALLVLFVPSAAFSRNHHWGGSQNGMISQYGNMGNYMGGSHGIGSLANNGINPYGAAPFAASAFANNGFNNFGNSGFNNGLQGMNNMNMMNGGMCGRHRHHKHKRRGLLNSLMMQNSMMGNGYGNYGSRGLFGGNSYGMGGYGGYGGYGGGLTGGLRNMLGRI